MKITDEFLEQVSMQRNLLSCIKNLVVLAKCIEELQGCIDELCLKTGLPRKFENMPEK
jgi:hypothetical protein